MSPQSRLDDLVVNDTDVNYIGLVRDECKCESYEKAYGYG